MGRGEEEGEGLLMHASNRPFRHHTARVNPYTPVSQAVKANHDELETIILGVALAKERFNHMAFSVCHAHLVHLYSGVISFLGQNHSLSNALVELQTNTVSKTFFPRASRANQPQKKQLFQMK